MSETLLTHRFDPTILREYDIRGIVGETLFEADAEALGRAFGTIVRENGGRKVAVGYDGRLSSPDLAAAVERGLRAASIDVARIGRGPTPMLYFAVYHLETDGGIQITGSHNPPNYNGFKMMLGKRAFFGRDIQRLGEIAANGSYAEGQGAGHDAPLMNAYVARILRDLSTDKGLTVAWDAGNGAVGDAMVDVVGRLPGTHYMLNETVDGTFPAHHPDPTVPENLEQLQRTVREKGCDLGFAFDGDGDRIGAVDGQGRILWGDQLMILIARDILKRKPGSTIIADVKASQVLFDEIAAAGGRPLMWKTGHSLIKSKMVEEDAPFAGEMSAHLFFADGWYGFDDALYAAVRILDILGRSGESLAAFRDSLPRVVNTPEIRFPCSEERKFAAVNEVKQRLADSGADVVAIDGVRVNTEDGWWLLRASNTQDVLVARCEARDEQGLARLKALLRDQLEASGVEVPAEL
ncbi:phosphoglucomutase/phosphomannomutase PgmG [Ferruginivarius sediminum]|uniref:Phosphomannomutase/phosphoglucomutase n=1 Tax=Ferruginivarius sediminum TaxID=2661937 RepID=A0A369TEM5_9PROT|nr:phosphomannomutase/phosphoglucomutase [Ferruginivarius sediminum]RDD62825.1 phosphomannomutase/phosphoglucomutase [Ferruginivarius sediminum]